MNIPSSVKIGGHIYKVSYPHQYVETSDYAGQCDNNTLEIRIADKTPTARTRPESCVIEIFIHELLHAISCVWHGQMEEDQVCAMSQGIFAFLVDNGYLPIVE